eukprot:1952727-Pleurochrysis_carterae.AAC.1
MPPTAVCLFNRRMHALFLHFLDLRAPSRCVCRLSTLPKFEGLDKSVAQKLSLWRAYFDSSDTHKERIPGSWQ